MYQWCNLFKPLKALLLCIVLFPVCSQAQTPYRVIVQKLNIRSGASSKSSVVGSLKLNDTIYVDEIKNNWASFLFKEKTRFVSSRYLEEVIISTINEVINEGSEITEEIEDTIKTDTIITPLKSEPRKSFFYRLFHKQTKQKKEKSGMHSRKLDERLSLIADVFGGYSNFAWNEGSPVGAIGYGVDVGAQCLYNLAWNKIPRGFFGELTIGYARRGSGAFPIHYFSIRVLPIAYRYSIRQDWNVVGKVGLYLGVPITSDIETSNYNYYSTLFDYGMSFSIGAEYKNFGLFLSYEHGFPEVISNSRVSLYNRCAFLSFSYKFTFK